MQLKNSLHKICSVKTSSLLPVCIFHTVRMQPLVLQQTGLVAPIHLWTAYKQDVQENGGNAKVYLRTLIYGLTGCITGVLDLKPGAMYRLVADELNDEGGPRRRDRQWRHHTAIGANHRSRQVVTGVDTDVVT